MFRQHAEDDGFEEIVLPTVEPAGVYTDKMGPEILGQMYAFPDKKGRPLCLRPEGTATCQLLARGPWKSKRDVFVWYEAKCFRYERPQAGRYREFTQLGVEILNPTQDYLGRLAVLLQMFMVSTSVPFEIKMGAKRGLQYYTQDGFEVECPILGAQKQVAGGGRYAEGIGFAVGLDRLELALTLQVVSSPPLGPRL